MQLVTLTTDWGVKDWYIGQSKGLLYSELNDISVIDITHNIAKYDLRSAAFVVKNACMNFPENTIHIIDISTYEDKNRGFVVVKYNSQYYICTDNGLPSMVFENLDIEITKIENVFSKSNYYTSPVKDVFIDVAKIINHENSADSLGAKIDKFAVESFFPKAGIFPNNIVCQVVYIDDYGNAFLNIDDVTFNKVLNERKFEIKIDRDCVITKLSPSYQDATMVGKALLTISATHNLELAAREDNFSQLLGYDIDSKIVINIK